MYWKLRADGLTHISQEPKCMLRNLKVKYYKFECTYKNDIIFLNIQIANKWEN